MITGTIKTKAGEIPRVSTNLKFKDILGAIRVRWGFGRDNYRVAPGLYATGNADESSDIFVSANYKLSFDHLRKNLSGINGWILVLDTKGINVWCAAGKGTFGTTELVHRIRTTGLDKIVSHRRLIVPQLGATGVSAYQVRKLTSEDSQEGEHKVSVSQAAVKSPGTDLRIRRGFNVVFGPVRAADISEFIKNGYKSTDIMRKVSFNMYDRLKLTPVDVMYANKKLLAALVFIFLLSGLNLKGFSFDQSLAKGLPAILNVTLAYFTGIVLTPILLPFIPVRMFAFKGLISGLVLSAVLLYFHTLGENFMEISAWILLISGISSFMAMNFTGASTFTSLSGVKKEMKVFVPVQITLAVSGLALLIVQKLI